MVFGWLRNRKRRKLLAEPFPAEWMGILEKNMWQYPHLGEEEQSKLRDLIRVFVAEKNWEGCGGQAMTDEVRVTVAAYACLLVLELDLDFYKNVISILVYPDEFTVPEKRVIEGEIVEESEDDRIGEAWAEGAVVLSWADAADCGRHKGGGVNVVVHEFAHQLDVLNRDFDGTPPLRDASHVPAWRKVMAAEYELLVKQVEAGRTTLLDPCGADDRAEFFATATETFFEKPRQLAKEKPALYGMLRQYYGQDPAERQARWNKAWRARPETTE